MPATDLHPELRRVAKVLPRRLISPRRVPMMQKANVLMNLRTPKDVQVEPLPSGAQLRVFEPPHGGSGGALLWIHGGGYVVGCAAQDDAYCRRLARALGITVGSVDYRLAPQHPYPAPLEDCYDGLVRLGDRPEVHADRIAIGGASAGGGLAAALAFLARDRGVPVALQLLSYPMLDDRTVERDDLDHPEHRLWDQQSNRYGWQSYLGDADRSRAVPARRTDLAGLAPAWIGVGTLDLFHDEDLAYAERLRAAEVPVELEVVRGAFHAFDGLAPKTPVARRFYDSQCTALRGALAVPAR
jgi:acetyl esterase/lipase